MDTFQYRRSVAMLPRMNESSVSENDTSVGFAAEVPGHHLKTIC